MSRIETRLCKLESIVRRATVTVIPAPGGTLRMTVPQARAAMAELKREIQDGQFPREPSQREREAGQWLLSEVRAINVHPEWKDYGFDRSQLSAAQRLAVGLAIWHDFQKSEAIADEERKARDANRPAGYIGLASALLQ